MILRWAAEFYNRVATRFLGWVLFLLHMLDFKSANGLHLKLVERLDVRALPHSQLFHFLGEQI